MKVTIQNLGAIQSAEIDLKPLTVLIGPNNAGKTWMAYTLAGIFGSHGLNTYASAYVGRKFEKKYPPLDNAIEQILSTGKTTINLVEFAEQYGESYFQSVARYAQLWMPDFMSTQFDVFDKMEISINLAESKALFLEQVKQSSLQVDVAHGTLKVSKKRGNPILQAYTSAENEESITEQIPSEEIKERLVRNVMRILHQALYSEIHVFPTERTTLVTFRLGSAKTQVVMNEKAREVFEAFTNALQRLRDLSEAEIEDFIAPEPQQGIGPIGYFLSMLGEVFQISPKEIRKREKGVQSNPKIKKYQQLAQVLEEEILDGNLDFSTPEPNARRDMLFYPRKNVALEMSIVSSMVKELAPLVLYLRYIAQPDELLIIDEPEMNLHPEAQAKMIEFLCMLVNAGLRVLVTTHSTYIVDQLTNLIYAAQLETEKQKSLAEVFFLENESAFIPQEKVSVYCVENGTAESILRENGRMDWDTFSNVSNRIANIHSIM